MYIGVVDVSGLRLRSAGLYDARVRQGLGIEVVMYRVSGLEVEVVVCRVLGIMC